MVHSTNVSRNLGVDVFNVRNCCTFRTVVFQNVMNVSGMGIEMCSILVTVAIVISKLMTLSYEFVTRVAAEV